MSVHDDIAGDMQEIEAYAATLSEAPPAPASPPVGAPPPATKSTLVATLKYSRGIVAALQAALEAEQDSAPSGNSSVAASVQMLARDIDELRQLIRALSDKLDGGNDD